MKKSGCSGSKFFASSMGFRAILSTGRWQNTHLIFTDVALTLLPSLPFKQVVTNLRGRTHSSFFARALAAAGGAPAHVSVDGADAWNGVAVQIGTIHGDPSHVTLQTIDGEVIKSWCVCAIVFHQISLPVSNCADGRYKGIQQDIFCVSDSCRETVARYKFGDKKI